jgi:hypothetical protein
MSVGSWRRVSVRMLGVVGAALFIAVFAAGASPAAAQSLRPEDPSHWGAKVSFVSSWTMADQIKKLLADDGSVLTVDGSEFEIGFVRGSRFGGDWGVSYVRKPWKDGSGDSKTSQDCFNQAQTICRPRTEVNATQNVILTGVEVHWFISFVTIKQRVQVGLNVAGGIAQTSGQVITTTDSFNPTAFNQQGPTAFQPVHEVETQDAKDQLFPYFPLFKLEPVVSVIVAPKIKVQVAYGVNFPSISPRVMAVVLF